MDSRKTIKLGKLVVVVTKWYKYAGWKWTYHKYTVEDFHSRDAVGWLIILGMGKMDVLVSWDWY